MKSEKTDQKPSASDTIMASALLAFSRNNNDATSGNEAAAPTADAASPSFPLPADMNSNIIRSTAAPIGHQTEALRSDWQLKTALEKAVTEAARGAALNHLLSASVFTQPVDPRISQLAHIKSEVTQNQPNVVAMYNGTIYNSPIIFATAHAAVETHNPGSELSAEQTLIRQKEIEKALRSKPQRGRKRANLNEVERLELTRTRNREHAKSTRVRKKMRYEELLECEARTKAIETKEDLEGRRRSCVVNFLAYRGMMIREQSLPNAESDSHLKLKGLFQDNSEILYNDGTADNENGKTIERMQKFDRLLLSGIIDKRPSISYKFEDSSGLHSIALSQSGIALVEVGIVQTIGVNDEKILQSFLLKCLFEPESDKIRSIAMLPIARSPLNDCTSNFEHYSAKNEGQHNLEVQISYPSVVSLDVEKDSRRNLDEIQQKRCEGDDGLGMSF